MQTAVDQPHDPNAFRPRFRLIDVFYVMALLCTGMATFRTYGLILAINVIIFWAIVIANRLRFRTAVLAVIVISTPCCCLFPVIESDEGPLRWRCTSNLRQIGLALHTYHDVYDRFPPAYVADESGQPMHSWRVLILPYLGEQALYKSYDFSEPWNGPNNIKLSSQMPNVFDCPSHQELPESGNTSYFAVVGKNTAWPGAESRILKEITDGTSNTILVIEHPARPTNWLDPSDLSQEEVVQLLSTSSREVAQNPHSHQNFFFDYFGVRTVTFADGTVRYLPRVTEETARNLVAIDDGAPEPGFDSFRSGSNTPPSRLRIGNCIRLSVLLVLIFLPFVRLARMPNSITSIPISANRISGESDVQ